MRTAVPLGLAGAAAVAVLVAALALRGSFGPQPPVAGNSGSTAPTSTQTPAATVTPQASATIVPTAPPNPPQGVAAEFTTPGATGNWSGFTWSDVPQNSILAEAAAEIHVLRWSGGYVAYRSVAASAVAPATPTVLWVSADGEHWTPIDQVTGRNALVAESASGLVAIMSDGAAKPTQAVWTSADGTTWTNRGTPKGTPFMYSLAGTRAGLVAVASSSGNSKGGPASPEVVFSTDGVNWTPEMIDPGLTYDSNGGPSVQSVGDRFLLTAFLPATASKASRMTLMASTPGTGVVWWSDDGQSWTRSTSKLSGTPMSIEVARNAILLRTSLDATPGGFQLYRSADGGKTWAEDAKFGPLGVEQCTGECAVGPDGVIAGNGTFFVAVKNDGHAWTSTDGTTWTPIAWAGPTQLYGMVVFPRGILLDGKYGAAK